MRRLAHPMLLATVVLALAFTPGPDAAAKTKEKSKAKGAFENVGPAPAAAGDFKFRLKKKKAKLKVKVENLEPHSTYSLRADGVNQAFFDTSGSGKGKVKLSLPAKKKGLLGFDPRARNLSIHGEEGDVLEAFFSNLTTAPIQLKESFALEPTELAGDGEAEVSIERDEDGAAFMEIQVKNGPPGTYSVEVDGVEQGIFEVDEGGEGEVLFDPLDFAVLGELLELLLADQAVFSGPAIAMGEGLNECVPQEIGLDLDVTQAQPGGEGDAILTIEEDCAMEFEVEVSDVDPNIYELLVGGDFVGSITASGDPGDANGDIEFETDPEDNGDNPLSFDPRGQKIEIYDEFDLIFEGKFPKGD